MTTAVLIGHLTKALFSSLSKKWAREAFVGPSASSCTHSLHQTIQAHLAHSMQCFTRLQAGRFNASSHPEGIRCWHVLCNPRRQVPLSVHHEIHSVF